MRPVVTLVALAAAAPSVAVGQTYLVLVSGLPGDPAVAAEWAEWSAALLAAARGRLGVPEDRVVHLANDPRVAPAPVWGGSTGENVRRAFDELAARAEPGAHVVVILFGHGSERGGEARFHLPGPDMTAADFASLLDLLPTQRVTFVNTASASGGFLPALSGPRRTIVTATRAGTERNRTHFGRFFVDALAGKGDGDKDGRVSILEAFDFARREVARFYAQRNALLTEHARLDDDGDGRGTGEPGPGGPDGSVAHVTYLGSRVAAAGVDDPRLAPLYAERERLEGRLAELRAQKEQLAEEVYAARLEEVLVALARTSVRIRALEREGRDP